MSDTVPPTQPANHTFTPVLEAKNGLDKTTFFGGCEYVPRQSRNIREPPEIKAKSVSIFGLSNRMFFQVISGTQSSEFCVVWRMRQTHTN